MSHLSRRLLLTGSLASVALLATSRAAANPPTAVREDDPTAKALGYVEDGAAVPESAYMRKGTGKQLCANCVLYQPGADGWGGCGAFPNKLVKAEAWCKAWGPIG